MRRGPRRRPLDRQQRLGEPHRRLQVDRQVAPHILPTGLRELAPPRGPGVVDEQVQPPAVLGLQVRADTLGGVRRQQIGREHRRTAAELAGERGQPLLAARDEDEADPQLAGQPPRGRLANAARGSGDERDEGRRGAANAPAASIRSASASSNRASGESRSSPSSSRNRAIR
jgi:hypothetical protein